MLKLSPSDGYALERETDIGARLPPIVRIVCEAPFDDEGKLRGQV